MIITATNHCAEQAGITQGMVLADARAIQHDLHVLDDKPDLPQKLLRRIGEWCIRFTPIVAVDPPDGLLLDASGCTHLWGGDKAYVDDITKRLNQRGYTVRVSIADTPSVAWGVARYGKTLLVEPGRDIDALLPLPPEALRLEPETIGKLHKLGLHQAKQFVMMPRTSLRKRFGSHFMTKLDQALGQEIELLEPVQPLEPYQERLPCMEPIVTLSGIEIALGELLKKLCERLYHDQKGLRAATFKCYRVDGKTEAVSIGTNRPSFNVAHLKKLFDTKLQTIDPALGIELFVIEAHKVDPYLPTQNEMWTGKGGFEDVCLSELIDRLVVKLGEGSVQRYLPTEHYWPERSFRAVSSLDEKPDTTWRMDRQRPLYLLRVPEKIDVTALIPDYPPMQFRLGSKVHVISKADGPERIEQEWWLREGEHRDYYRVEDEEGNRYWLFRSGHYNEKNFKWFLHGYFS
jgi:protein ImuB